MFRKALGKFFAKRKRRRKRSETFGSSATKAKEMATQSMPLLYALARSWAWEAVAFRCQTHPHEVSETFVDDLGETILHWACLGKPPIKSILAILERCPEMSKTKNRRGQLPLHVAISYRASADVLRALLEAYPTGAKIPNSAGSYPIHLLCDYGFVSVDSLRALLETKEGASTITIRDRATGLSPLHILNARKNSHHWRRAIASMKETRNRQQEIRKDMERTTQSQEIGAGQRLMQDTETSSPEDRTAAAPSREDPLALLQRQERMIASFQQNDHWQKAALLVLVEYTKQPLTEEGLVDVECSIVHACAGIAHCPSSLLEFAVLLHADDLIEKKDTRGRLPLHVAAATHAAALISRASIAGSTVKQDRSEEALLSLLAACPEAAFVSDNEGYLPLTVALQVQRQQWQPDGIAWSRGGLQRLLAVNPSALETLNLDQRLYPHVWANRMGSNVDELYRSIRRNPNLFQLRARADCRFVEV